MRKFFINPLKTNGNFHKASYIIKSGWSIVNIEGAHVIIKKNFFLKIDCVEVNSADPYGH